MKRCLGLFLLLCAGMFHSGFGLRCYKCSGNTNNCQNMQECTDKDCISQSETVEDCTGDDDCKPAKVSAGFTYRCCSSTQCNSGNFGNSSNAVTAATLALALAGSLLSIWWCRH